MSNNHVPVLHVGARAYWDSVAYGLVACRVTELAKGPYGGSSCAVVITKPRALYKSGDTISTNPDRVFPASAITRAKYGTRVRSYIVSYQA